MRYVLHCTVCTRTDAPYPDNLEICHVELSRTVLHLEYLELSTIPCAEHLESVE